MTIGAAFMSPDLQRSTPAATITDKVFDINSFYFQYNASTRLSVTLNFKSFVVYILCLSRTIKFAVRMYTAHRLLIQQFYRYN